MEILIKSFAHIVQSDFLGKNGGKYENKMCKVIYSVFP